MCADLAERRGDDSISGKKSFDIYIYVVIVL